MVEKLQRESARNKIVVQTIINVILFMGRLHENTGQLNSIVFHSPHSHVLYVVHRPGQ